MEDHNTLAQRLIRRLGDVWHGEEPTSLANEDDLRAWIALNHPPSSGNTSSITPACHTSIQTRVTLRVGNEERTILAVRLDHRPEKFARWPKPLLTPVRRAGARRSGSRSRKNG